MVSNIRHIRLGTSLFLSVFVLIGLTYHYQTFWPAANNAFTHLLDNEDSHRYAFATFLGANTHSASPYDEDDPYFMSVRQLAYKLLHAGSSTPSPIPLLVLCTSEVSSSKRARLEEDGATVVLVQDITSTSFESPTPRWRDALTKLRLFELTDYTKICYMDADMFVVDDLSEIFQDSATLSRHTFADLSEIEPDEAPLPKSYLMAGHNDKNIPAYMNAGFFVFSPSRTLFTYYLSLLDKQERFNPPGYMEQSILNYAHRPYGNMPWMVLPEKWYSKVHHNKYWLCETTGCPGENYVVGAQWMVQREEMRRYWSTQIAILS